MKRLLLLCVAAFYSVTFLFAESRTPDEILAIAQNHFQTRAMGATRSTVTPVLVASSGQLFGKNVTRGGSGEEAFFIFNAGQQQFVIVSGDDRMKPVLAYSDNGPFVTKSIPEHILGWLRMYVEEMDALSRFPADQTNLFSSAAVTRTNSFPQQVEPLLGNLKWNQDAPYNNLCPVYEGEQLVTGCVATAMAMVLKYHNYPEQGTGQNTYTSKTLNIESSFDFGATTFDWDNMLPTYVQGAYSDVQATAVATLMKACGVAVDMDYNLASAGGSGATSYSIVGGLVNYFDYDPNVRYLMRDYYSSTEWMELIKTELSEARPVLYGGSSTEGGHQFVFDGYDAQDMVHVNWGWNGQDDGYFEVTSLSPSSPGIGGGTAAGGGFVYDQSMIIGIQKPTPNSQYVSQFIVQSSVQLSTDEVNKGGDFNIILSELYNVGQDFNGELGALLIKGDETIVLEQQSVNVPSMAGWSETSFSTQIPTSVSDGDYLLCIATKGNQEASWSKVRAMQGYDVQFNAHVEGDNVTFTSTVPKLQLSGTFQVEHALYSASTGDFSVNITNQGDAEYYGQAVILLVPEDEAGGGQVVATAQLDLEPGAQQAVVLSGTVEAAAGDYTAYLGVAYGGNYQLFGNSVDVTVKPKVTEATGMSLISPVTLPETNISEGEKLTLQFQVECTGGIYDNSLYAFIFAAGQTGSSSIYFSQKVFLEAGSQSVVMSGLPGVGPGTYTAVLCYMKNSSLVQLAETPEFVVSAGTGIEDEAAEQEFIIYPQPVADVLNIRSNKNVSKIEVVGISGQTLKQENVSILAGETYTLPVSDLTKGYYILILHSEDKTYREKFIKK
ncbi:C10 family peptidase [Bacteroides sp.]